MEKRRRWRAATRESQEAARAMRKAMTPAEAALWQQLRRDALDGVSFRRQHAVGRFVIDFYAPALRLGVEVDGGVHDERKERDDQRSEALGLRGIRIIRFRNEDVLTDMERVLGRIHWEARLQRNGEPEI